jgi:hypothetical protein
VGQPFARLTPSIVPSFLDLPTPEQIVDPDKVSEPNAKTKRDSCHNEVCKLDHKMPVTIALRNCSAMIRRGCMSYWRADAGVEVPRLESEDKANREKVDTGNDTTDVASTSRYDGCGDTEPVNVLVQGGHETQSVD